MIDFREEPSESFIKDVSLTDSGIQPRSSHVFGIRQAVYIPWSQSDHRFFELPDTDKGFAWIADSTTFAQV